MTAETYFGIDGQPVPADECMWVKVAPCGCECGWSLAKYVASVDMAWEDFSRSKAVRRRDELRGYTVVIKRRTEVRLSDDCPHTPRWGVEPRPQPAGHTWAGTYDGRTLHLVPLVIAPDSNSGYRHAERVASICKRASGYTWSTEWHLLDGRTECVNCLTAAKKLPSDA